MMYHGLYWKVRYGLDTARLKFGTVRTPGLLGVLVHLLFWRCINRSLIYFLTYLLF